MKRIARLTGLFSILLILFALTLLMSQRMLQRQTERLRVEALARMQSQLVAAVELAALGPPPWSDEVTAQLGQALGAEIRTTSHPAGADGDARATAVWSFSHQFGAPDSGPPVHLVFAPPPAARLLQTYQRVATILLNLALGVIVVFAALLLWSIRMQEAVDETREADRANTRAGLQSLQHLASVSARQSDELERERAERLRAEENLNIKQLLLNRALEQKIRLGQDLHDGIIQSLYATGLTLEATRALVPADPRGADERIASVTRALNGTIREVRAYINGLSPDTLRRQTFASAVDVLTRDLAAGRPTEFIVSVDEPTASALAEDAVTDLLQVVREGVSNSLRHGAATRVTIKLQPGADTARLVVSDNGSGFSQPSVGRSGHGLDNIHARIRRHGGVATIESAAGHGTTITCSVPLGGSRPA